MSHFNARDLVREVLRSSTRADPGDVAAEVYKRIPASHRGDALQQLLRLFVRQVISEERTSHAPSVVSAVSGRSAKVRSIRDAWQRRLKDRVHVGDAHWKFLRDCTYEDLLAAANERRELADRNAAWARTYSEWAALMTDHNVQTFGQLPPTVLQDALGAAA